MWKQDLRSPTNPPKKPNLFSISKIRKWKTEIKTKTKPHKLCLLYSLQNKQNKTNLFLMPVSYFNNLWSQETVHRGTFSWLSVANILHSVPLKCFYFLTCQTKWGNNWHRVISKCTEKTSPFCRAAGWIPRATLPVRILQSLTTLLSTRFPCPHQSVVSKAHSTPRSIKLLFSICRGRLVSFPEATQGVREWTLEVHVVSQCAIHQNSLLNQF